jgi:hypothetical protein
VFKLKIIYIASLILLGLMVLSTVFKPLAKGAHYNDVQRESLIKNEQELVLQFSLINSDAGAVTYQIDVDKDGQLYRDEEAVAGQGEYTYIQHFQRQKGKDRNLDVAVYSKGNIQPDERLHCNLQ